MRKRWQQGLIKIALCGSAGGFGHFRSNLRIISYRFFDYQVRLFWKDVYSGKQLLIRCIEAVIADDDKQKARTQNAPLTAISSEEISNLQQCKIAPFRT
jgi:hypothetical protein